MDSPDGANLAQSEAGGSPGQTSTSETEAWSLYFQRMRHASRAVQGMKGWPHFKHVFMVSALSGDGVAGVQVKPWWAKSGVAPLQTRLHGVGAVWGWGGWCSGLFVSLLNV